MDKMEKLVVKIICDLWKQSNGLLNSEDIYERLISDKVNVPENSLNEIFIRLENQGYIKCIKFHNRDEVIKHGALTIKWISPHLSEYFE